MSALSNELDSNKGLYEEFHSNAQPITRITSVRDFGMANHLPLFSKYLTSDQTVLDIGCGGGPFSIFAASLGATVKGIDLSEREIAANKCAKESLGLNNLTFENDDFMSYLDHSIYDVVILAEVLEHLSDDSAALKKIFDLLKPGGTLLMSVPSLNAPLHKYYLRRYGEDPFDKRVGHLRRYKAVDVFNLLYESGFRLVEFRLCEGYLRNWLYNDPLGQFFMRFNRKFVKNVVTFVDNNFFVPLFGESDIIVAARKR